MLALRTVTYCTENEETPPGRTVRHRPDQDGSDLRRRVACGRRHPGQHLRSRWHRRSGHQRGAARRRATGSRAAVSWHAKSPIGNVGIAPLAESSSPLGGTRSEQEDRRSVHRFIGSSVHRFIGSSDQRISGRSPANSTNSKYGRLQRSNMASSCQDRLSPPRGQ